MWIFNVEELNAVGTLLRMLGWGLILLPVIPGLSRYFFKFYERKPRLNSFDEIPIKMVDKIPGISEEVAEIIFMVIRFIFYIVLIVLYQLIIGAVFK